jgi:hypothetical protein
MTVELGKRDIGATVGNKDDVLHGAVRIAGSKWRVA